MNPCAQPNAADVDGLVALYGSGKFRKTEKMARRLIRKFPRAPIPLNVLGLALAGQGKFKQAVASYRRALKIKPDFAMAHNNLGNALKGLGKLEEAVASYRQALRVQADFAQFHNNLGSALLDLGSLEEAIVACRRALKIDPRSAEAHYNMGGALQGLGKLEEAVASYRHALEINPKFAMAHNNLGVAYRELGNIDEAIASCARALKIMPNYVKAHNNLGIAFKELGKLDEAVASYRKALAIKPDYAAAHYNLAEVFEKTNRTEALRVAVRHAGRTCPGHPRVALMEAQLLKRDGEYAAALAVLERAAEPISDADFSAARAYLLGDLCDRLGNVEFAYDRFSEGNLRCKDTARGRQIDKGRYLAQIDLLAERFTANWIADWRPLEIVDKRPDPVFLVGFPRSGTTLLNTILRSHSAVAVVEEVPTMRNVEQLLGRFPGGYPDGLANLDSAHHAQLRQTYFTELDKHLKSEKQSDVVIDKLPLNIVKAGLIHRIFPHARFVFVQRHPCDCVLSCFMQNFRLNDAMVNFLNLDDAARLYDKVMTLWQQYQAVLPLRVHTVRYESLVEAFEETMAPVFDFLGVGWNDGVRNYAETARRLEKIDTPSYNQVTQPLYTRARGRWERYRKHLEPVLPRLLPWATRFGYDE